MTLRPSAEKQEEYERVLEAATEIRATMNPHMDRFERQSVGAKVCICTYSPSRAQIHDAYMYLFSYSCLIYLYLSTACIHQFPSCVHSNTMVSDETYIFHRMT